MFRRSGPSSSWFAGRVRPGSVPALLGLIAATSLPSGAPAGPPGPVRVAQLQDDPIGPGTLRYLLRALDEAEDDGAQCLVILLDTPGGLLQSTRKLVKRMLASSTCVIVYVAPSGARAASAGMFVTLAGHIAAMAPGTTIGAAHPVRVGGLPAQPAPGEETEEKGSSAMEEKIVNDTVAWARSLAGERGRNADWAAKAVSESVSATAEEAVEKEVVDLLAAGLDELLRKADGKVVPLPRGPRTLETAGAPVERVSMWWGERVLAAISDPNIAFLLMIFGFYGLLFELYSPGWGVAGTIGVIALLLGLFGLSALPVNYLGVALLIVSFALFAAEVFVTSYGALAVAGIACLILGGLMLVDSPSGFSRVSLGVLVPVAAATAVVTVFLVAGIARAHRGRVQTGGESLVGEEAEAMEDFSSRGDRHAGTVFTHGERWTAESGEPVKAGQRCRVEGRRGLTLIVKASGASHLSEK